MIFDTHAHYDDKRFEGDRFETLTALPQAGVGRVIIPATDPGNLAAVLTLAREVDFVYAALGFHPHSAAELSEKDFEQLENLLRDNDKIVAVGECGLDYHYDIAPRETQKAVFRRQLVLGVEMNLPVIVHDREAHADCLACIKETPGVGGVFHCYSGSAEMVPEIVGMGFMISFTGSVTFANAHKLRHAAALVPDERLMVETDAPYMAPVPHRGKRCDSRMIVNILDVLAEVRGTTREDLERLTWENAFRFFGLGVPVS